MANYKPISDDNNTKKKKKKKKKNVFFWHFYFIMGNVEILNVRGKCEIVVHL